MNTMTSFTTTGVAMSRALPAVAPFAAASVVVATVGGTALGTSGTATSGSATWRERVGSVDASRLHVTDHNSIGATAGLPGYAAAAAATQAIAAKPAAPPRGERR